MVGSTEVTHEVTVVFQDAALNVRPAAQCDARGSCRRVAGMATAHIGARWRSASSCAIERGAAPGLHSA